jgi:hypothetical protein
MQWTLIPASIAAVAALITLAWRIRDALLARPKIIVHSAQANYSSRSSAGCDGWQGGVHVENLSTANDVVRAVRVNVTGHPAPLEFRTFSSGRLPMTLEPGTPARITGDLTAGPIGKPGATIQGVIEIEFTRAGIVRHKFEATC